MEPAGLHAVYVMIRTEKQHLALTCRDDTTADGKEKNLC